MDLETAIGIGEAARILRVSISTMRKWDRQGKRPKPRRDRDGNRRYDPLEVRKIAKVRRSR